ncbi:hypothetical protein PAXINDRAFT_158207 [Paxillus involutus ATCC 200175]|uniref:Uncharacterized protein n=1 Tax=Paxillus involutus ATCC 200175 TaxID=664439 RepID=A0A0C9TLL8_PAXIN|nr:hypothetical protein PAXINDRAFT_158207 [Paxillus involutus ATCC 200175]
MSDLISTPTFDVGCFPGLRDAMSPGGTSTLELQEVADDVAAEQETLPVSEAATDVDELGPEFAQLQATLLEASKGVTDGTDMEYKRLMQQCEAFLVSMGLLRNGEVFFCRTPRREVPTFIVAWIMNTCSKAAFC